MTYGIYPHTTTYKLKDGTIRQSSGFVVRQRLRPNKHISIHRTRQGAQQKVNDLNGKVNNRPFDHNRTFTKWPVYEEMFKDHKPGDEILCTSNREANRICWALRRYSDLHGKDWIVKKKETDDGFLIRICEDS